MVDFSYWAGTLVSALLTLIYAYFALYPRTEGAHKIALWMLAPAIVATVTQSGMIIDIGGTLRADAVEFNFVRWIYYTVSLMCVSAVMGSYLWFEFVNGWWIIVFGTLSGVFTVFAGLATGDRRWPLIAGSMLFVLVWAVWVFFKPRYNSPEAKVPRSKGSKRAAFWFSVAYVLSIALSLAVFFFSDALIDKMTFATATWIYLATTLTTLAVPLIAVYDYQPDTVEKND